MYIALILAVVNMLLGCVPHVSSIKDHPKTVNTEPEYFSKNSVTMELSNASRTAVLGADIYRPKQAVAPKSLVIMIPGSGNVSRDGEVTGDGIDNYPEKIFMYEAWAKALSNQGLWVLSFDKRTCQASHNPICNNNSTKDIDASGIRALADDLDEVFLYAQKKLSPEKIVLFSTSQGAQVIALSSALKQVHGVVLISPILDDLPAALTNGLLAAAEGKNQWQNMTLKNRAESMRSFFDSLKRGDFLQTAQARGASVKFWHSWIDAAKETKKLFAGVKVPVLVQTAKHDPFAVRGKAGPLRHLEYDDVDRNFVVNGAAYGKAVQDVVKFINR